jgi:hypothetical protein
MFFFPVQFFEFKLFSVCKKLVFHWLGKIVGFVIIPGFQFPTTLDQTVIIATDATIVLVMMIYTNIDLFVCFCIYTEKGKGKRKRKKA